jgi:divalent metal cation (Fe/Co/Zn/Cd) transporter
MSQSGSKQVIIVSLMANLGIALSKLIASLFTGSASMMAESIHSFSDCGNQLLILYGNHASTRPASDRHPLGNGKEAFFWSFIVALLLFSVGGSFSIYEGFHKLKNLEPISFPMVAITVL